MSDTGESTQRLHEFHNRTVPDIAELLTGDRDARCVAPGDQEHDHEMCNDVIEEARDELAYRLGYDRS